MKQKLIPFILFFIAITVSAQDVVYDFDSEIEVKKKEKQIESPYSMFGDNTIVLQTKHEKKKDHTLKIPLLEDDRQIGLFELDYQTRIVTIKNIEGQFLLNQKLSQEQLSRFLTVDPLAEEYYSWSPYVYVMNNPMKYIDPDGRSTWVMKNSDGTYRVVGGDLEDKDHNIYVYSIQDGNLARGESLGVTTSMTSFYDSDANDGEGSWVIGANIDPNDRSGEDFFGGIIGNTPAMDDYMKNATKGEHYDFKRTNGGNASYESKIDFYRGMPIGSKGGKRIYTSARDIGNMAAGYIAGANGMPWGASRVAFDALQSYQVGKPSIEGSSTRNAEFFGWKLGYNNVPTLKKLENFKKAIRNFLGF